MDSFITLWSGISPERVLSAASKSSLYSQDVVTGSDIWDEQPVLLCERLALWLAAQKDALDDEGAVWWCSSGTTGSPLTGAFPTHFHSTYLLAAYERLFSLCGDKSGFHAHLCAPRTAPASIDLAAQSWEKRIRFNDLYLMSKGPLQDWTGASFARIFRDLNEIRPQTLRADPFYLAAFLRWLIRNDKVLPACPVIICSYSPLTTNLRKAFVDYFGVPVWDLFAMSECGPLYFYDGLQCIPWDDGILYEGRLLATDVCGESVYSGFVSSIRNPYYPLLRYQSGDLFQQIDGPDGRNAYVNCGREVQVISLPDGSLITQRSLDQIFRSFPQIWAFCARVRGGQISVDLMFSPGSESPVIVNEIEREILSLTRNYFAVSVSTSESFFTQPSGKVTPVLVN